LLFDSELSVNNYKASQTSSSPARDRNSCDTYQCCLCSRLLAHVNFDRSRHLRRRSWTVCVVDARLPRQVMRSGHNARAEAAVRAQTPTDKTQRTASPQHLGDYVSTRSALELDSNRWLKSRRATRPVCLSDCATESAMLARSLV